MAVTVIDHWQRAAEFKLLGHFREVGESPTLNLHQSVDSNEELITATFTGLKQDGLGFSFNPSRRWEYKTKLGKNDHVFTVYYILNGIVRGIADSVIFHIVESSKWPRFTLVLSEITVNDKLKNTAISKRDREEDHCSSSKPIPIQPTTKKSKKSALSEATNCGEENVSSSVDPNNEDRCSSPFSTLLYSFQDQDDLYLFSECTYLTQDVLDFHV